MKASALIIDGDVTHARSMAQLLEREGVRVEVTRSGEEAFERLGAVPLDLALVDLTSLPGMDGVEVLRRLREHEPQAVCIAIEPDHGGNGVTAAAISAGASDVISRAAAPEEAELRLRQGLEVAEQRRLVEILRDEERRTYPAEIVGDSPAIEQARAAVVELAATPPPGVLITGEPGTGKRLIARVIHRRSPRGLWPLLTVRCSASSGTPTEHELLGHEAGALPGAAPSGRGLLERAHRGALVVEEVGELSPALQERLLRVLEDRRFRRVGGEVELEADVLILATSTRDLRPLVAEGRFRADLHDRLAAHLVSLPPLRERGNDVLLLARYLAERIGERQLGRRIQQLDLGSEAALLRGPFPGNVRQLRNLVERALIEHPSEPLRLDLPSASGGGAPASASDLPLDQQLAEVQRREKELGAEEFGVIQRALQQAGGNKTAAARLLGISRYALQRRLRRFTKPTGEAAGGGGGGDGEPDELV